MSDRHVVVTVSELEHLSKEGNSLTEQEGLMCSAEVYITKPLTAEKIKSTVIAFLLENELLFFPTEFKVLTEPIKNTGEMEEVKAVFTEAGYNVTTIETCEKRGKYLSSDGGGHYSTDFYEWIEFGCITITSL